jgi:hypothetical protein
MQFATFVQAGIRIAATQAIRHHEFASECNVNFVPFDLEALIDLEPSMLVVSLRVRRCLGLLRLFSCSMRQWCDLARAVSLRGRG